MLDLILLVISLFVVIKSADLAIRYASSLAYFLGLPKYVVGFILVAVISILPETLIAIHSAGDGVPAFGLGTLFGSNVADLTLILAIVILSTSQGVKVSSKILQDNKWYPLLLAFPIFVGWDGYYSRVEGWLLVATGIFFYYWTFRRNGRKHADHIKTVPYNYLHIIYLLASMAGLLLGAHWTAKYGVALAQFLHINPVLIAMLVVGLGTTLPELFFSLRAVKNKGDDLALGDILGTVIADATIAVGILALIKPFNFPTTIIYITAVFMVLASLLAFYLMRSGQVLKRREGLMLLVFYIVFVLTEYFINS